MKRIGIALLASLAFTAAHAADSLTPGKYSGGYERTTRTGANTIGLEVDIKEVSGNKVKGVALMSRNGSCDGEYPMEGTFKGGKLSLKATQRGGKAGDCGFSFTASLEGNKLVGKTHGGSALTLSR
jgi:hypothetical protein